MCRLEEAPPEATVTALKAVRARTGRRRARPGSSGRGRRSVSMFIATAYVTRRCAAPTSLLPRIAYHDLVPLSWSLFAVTRRLHVLLRAASGRRRCARPRPASPSSNRVTSDSRKRFTPRRGDGRAHQHVGAAEPPGRVDRHRRDVFAFFDEQPRAEHRCEPPQRLQLLAVLGARQSFPRASPPARPGARRAVRPSAPRGARSAASAGRAPPARAAARRSLECPPPGGRRRGEPFVAAHDHRAAGASRLISTPSAT